MIQTNLFDLWTWPFRMSQYSSDLVETMTGAQRVVSARLPLLDAAFRNPRLADHRELG